MTTDPIIDWLTENGVPVTRETYIELNWMGAAPDPWTPEDEAQLPPELQLSRPDLISAKDAWEERLHPRKGKGPGGGEFTVKGSGSFGGGPTIHIHTEGPHALRGPEAPPVSIARRDIKNFPEKPGNGRLVDIHVGDKLIATYHMMPGNEFSNGLDIAPGHTATEAMFAMDDVLDALEKQLGHNVVPNPFSLSMPERTFWVQRLAKMPISRAQAIYKRMDELIDEAVAKGDRWAADYALTNHANVQELATDAEMERARNQPLSAAELKKYADPRYQSVGDKPFTGPHARENAELTGRLIASDKRRHYVEKLVKETGLKLMDVTEVPPHVAQVFGMEAYKDGSPKATQWWEANERSAEGLQNAMDVLEKKGFGRLIHELRENTTVVFGGIDPERFANNYAAVWVDKDGHQWLNANANATAYAEAPKQYRKPNNVATRLADNVIFSGKNIDVDTPKAQMIWNRSSMLHEYGHVLDNLTHGEMSDALNAKVRRLLSGDIGIDAKASDWMRQHVSDYSGTNKWEAAAEVWATALEDPDSVPPAFKKWVKAARSAAGEDVVAEFEEA